MITKKFSPVLAEKLQLESTNKSISEIEVPEVKPAIFQQIIGTFTRLAEKLVFVPFSAPLHTLYHTLPAPLPYKSTTAKGDFISN